VAGAEAVVLGCTELPLAVPEAELDGLPIVDPTRILARALIRAVTPARLRIR
jgi:aspartate racemase